MRGGTEQYFERANPGLKFADPETTTVAFQAIAAEIAAAEPEPYLVLRTLMLSDDQASHVLRTLRDLEQHTDDNDCDDAGDARRYGLLLGFYQARRDVT